MTTRGAIDGAAAWEAADMDDPSVWTVPLSDQQRDEIVAAARAAESSGTDRAELLPGDFELSSLPAGEWSRTLADGRGFLLIRGFPIDRLTGPQIELAYLGLGLQLGTPVSQNAAGDLLGHVRDERVPRTDPSVRLYQTRERQDFHTDGSDLVGLLCLQKAVTGGESRIASAAAVYNRMLARRADLVDILYEPMYWDRNGEESPGEDPFFALPVMSDVSGSPRMFFISWYIRDAQRHEQVPRLSGPQSEAIRFIEETANDPDVYVAMEFEPGDIQLLSNARLLHSREAYTDHPEPARRRHLLRLWLAAHTHRTVDDVLRGGIPPRK